MKSLKKLKFKTNDEVIIYENECSISNTATISYSWSIKGKQPIIEQKQRQRERQTLFGCVEPETASAGEQSATGVGDLPTPSINYISFRSIMRKQTHPLRLNFDYYRLLCFISYLTTTNLAILELFPVLITQK